MHFGPQVLEIAFQEQIDLAVSGHYAVMLQGRDDDFGVDLAEPILELEAMGVEQVLALGYADADMVRLQRALTPLGAGPLEISLELLRKMPGRLRETGFRGTAVLCDGHLIDFEPGNTEAEQFAVALDVGTTTLVGVLLDLNTGQQRAVCSRLNPQTRFGDDVLSRILHVQQDPEGLNELHESIVGAVNEMIDELIAELIVGADAGADISHRQIYEAVFAGNTTMQQLLLGVDPSSLAQVPFVPTMETTPAVQAAELNLHVHPRASVHTLPAIEQAIHGVVMQVDELGWSRHTDSLAGGRR